MIYSQGASPERQLPEEDKREMNDIWSESPNWKQKTMENFIPPSDWSSIVRSIQDDTCIAVTDGSYDPLSKNATACWIIEGRTSDGRAKGASLEQKESMDAYRAEIFGIYCIMMCVYSLCTRFNITKGSLTIACDCNGSLF